MVYDELVKHLVYGTPLPGPNSAETLHRYPEDPFTTYGATAGDGNFESQSAEAIRAAVARDSAGLDSGDGGIGQTKIDMAKMSIDVPTQSDSALTMEQVEQSSMVRNTDGQGTPGTSGL